MWIPNLLLLTHHLLQPRKHSFSVEDLDRSLGLGYLKYIRKDPSHASFLIPNILAFDGGRRRQVERQVRF